MLGSMKPPTSDVAFTPTVKALQEKLGSRKSYAKLEASGGWSDRVTDELAAFLATRQSFYFGTASGEGRPYIQHRGGPAGLLKVLDEHTLAFAEYGGNKQYISMGNLAENDRAFIFLMDYSERRRFKIWGRAEFVEGDGELLARVSDPDYAGKPQRVLRFTLEAWDRNCPQHIPQLFSEAEVEARERELRDRIVALTAELEAERAQSAETNQ
jgi:predicted pyridoxine 5'-phosphate oxidase superfamily flavin-nucleotide-binding protein